MVDPEILKNYILASGVKFRNGAVSYIFTCPICNKKDKLYIRKKDGLFVCFYCKNTERFQGKPEFALAKLLSLPVGEVQAQLYGLAPTQFKEIIKVRFKNAPFDDYVLEEMKEEELEEIVSDLPELCWPPDFITPRSQTFSAARTYLYGRGITEELINKYQIKYQPSQRRVIFPVMDKGSLLGWQGRFIEKTEVLDSNGVLKYHIPKILTSKGLTGGKYLMFQDNLINSKHAILTEGPVDCIKADLCGGNVAAMGKGVSKGQIETLISSGIEKLYLALDPDAATDTDRIAKEVHKLSHNSIKMFLIEPPAGKEDLGDCTLEEVFDQFKKAEELTLPRMFIYFR